jgi:orotate phosphoribosyltransferase
LDVIGMVSIFTYGFDVAEKAFRDASVNFLSLTNFETLVELAIEKGIVSKEQEVILLDWRRNPGLWQGVS